MHIDANSLETVQRILRSHLPGCEIWAFGSRVHGRNLKKFSDLDLAIISTTPLDPLLLADLKEAFSESDLPFKVDLLDRSTVSEIFRRIIDKKHVVIQAAENAGDTPGEG